MFFKGLSDSKIINSILNFIEDNLSVLGKISLIVWKEICKDSFMKYHEVLKFFINL